MSSNPPIDVIAITDNMNLARQCADAAAFMDTLKNVHAPAERDIAKMYVEALHDIAEILAGDRVHEIYGEPHPDAP